MKAKEKSVTFDAKQMMDVMVNITAPQPQHLNLAMPENYTPRIDLCQLSATAQIQVYFCRALVTSCELNYASAGEEESEVAGE